MKIKGWKERLIGGIIDKPGSSREYETGEWRSFRPVLDKQKCINCMICWVFCPDESILVENGEVVGIDYYHCKGCGICAKECPKDALQMRPEEEFRKEEL